MFLCITLLGGRANDGDSNGVVIENNAAKWKANDGDSNGVVIENNAATLIIYS